jgi:hypothetical protein
MSCWIRTAGCGTACSSAAASRRSRAPRTPSIVGLLYMAVTPTIGFAYAAAWMVLVVAATVVVRHREPRVTR